MKMRLPATPLFTIDPYFTVWADQSVQKTPKHWTDKPQTISVKAVIDGVRYHLLGFCENGSSDMPIENVDVDAFSTIITYKLDTLRLVARLTSPLLPTDLYYASRPVAYMHISYEALDGKKHSVECSMTVSEELVLKNRNEGEVARENVRIDGVSAIRMGNKDGKPLSSADDHIRIDWGYIYLGVKGEGEAFPTVLDGMSAISVSATVNKDALFLLAYDDIYSIQYFGDNLKAYWCNNGKTIEEAIAEASLDYEEILCRCNEFSDKLYSDALTVGNEKYAEILLLSVRQAMATHKLVVDKEGNNLYISKECTSGACAATVDVTYPSAPMYLLYNPELLRGMIRPVMKYAMSEEWTFDFAPHDEGLYPLLNGQFYGVERDEQGKATIKYDMQMPVEECGNMIILFELIADITGSLDFVAPYMDIVKEWSKYLLRYGLDPENQLCTDDFAGHLAHNVNLAIKAIMGIVAYSRLLSRFGDSVESEKMLKIAHEYSQEVLSRSRNTDGSYRLAYDKPDTFSLKYNAIWDKLWGTNIFPPEFYEAEIGRYKRELMTYGVPLDSREKYTKSDWTIWAAALAEKREDFDLFIDALWSAYNEMETRNPLPDWYYCDSAKMQMFCHRSVVAGHFLPLLFRK